ncbi:M56 family metallopeptidase [Flavobacterium acetivorans]|uniref:M56 family metallopeptidase n=1 Tax=Flavobacterium acetivorans TaxID=2893883 RepID=UPI001E42D976|nr:M56 family metallopeptidase [Flavobacterium sp. F-29]UFH36501.1 M56 family metallopeptidase [Flavobacterium sp. F-29]
MIDFLIKSTLSLVVLLAVYHLALEKEKMHHFNRLYLLFSILFSFSIPFITIEVIQEVSSPEASQNIITMEGSSTAVLEDSTNYWLIAVWSLYTLLTLVLLLRFILNIIKLTARTKSNPTIDYKNSKLVLVQEETLPYTFLNSIFINETDYHHRKIEAELYTHELIHVSQRHTLDILFIETLKVIFWFNPIFIFYKKAIQLNHEFLADEKVVKSHNNVPFYQNLLLSKANANPTYYLASNLNYSVTKKRLIMMTKTTSPSRTVLKKLVLIPLFTGLTFLVCTKIVAQETKTTKKQEPSKTSNIFDDYYNNTTFKIKDEKGKVTTQKKYKELTPIEKKAIPSFIPKKEPLPTPEELLAILKKGASESIEIDIYDPKNQKVKKSEGETHNVSELTENPSYPEGMEKFYSFVAQNYKIPTQANLKGKIYVTFIVEVDGSLSDIKLLRDIGYGTGEEAVRVLKLSPKWNPGKVNGEAVRTMYSLPITIQSKI